MSFTDNKWYVSPVTEHGMSRVIYTQIGPKPCTFTDIAIGFMDRACAEQAVADHNAMVDWREKVQKLHIHPTTK